MAEENIVVQGPREILKQDGDGYILFDTPCELYIQTEEGRATEMGGHYTQIAVDEDGDITVKTNNVDKVIVESRT